MTQHAGELPVEALVIANAFDEVALGHPFEMQDQQRHRQRLVLQHGLGDHLGRADHLALRAEALLELGTEALEEIDVLGLLPGELQEGAAARVIAGEAWARVIEQEGQDELLDQAELVEIAVAADLVQQQLLARRQAVERRDAGERLGHERLVKI
jgi:hypothetical protein